MHEPRPISLSPRERVLLANAAEGFDPASAAVQFDAAETQDRAIAGDVRRIYNAVFRLGQFRRSIRAELDRRFEHIEKRIEVLTGRGAPPDSTSEEAVESPTDGPFVGNSLHVHEAHLRASTTPVFDAFVQTIAHVVNRFDKGPNESATEWFDTLAELAAKEGQAEG